MNRYLILKNVTRGAVFIITSLGSIWLFKVQVIVCPTVVPGPPAVSVSVDEAAQGFVAALTPP